ncbi:MAG: prepilin-type N-terminal cleavage/methylation domain-containing protein, partial [Elusimicrobiaceae bacterium]|nr:prepilin-type N-terminal cleavage/methylation domain-containing protein [Elusimicrobiaceae bacterium]
MQSFNSKNTKRGFTLMEVLVVVVIGVLVTLFAVPAYKKMQDR